MLLKITTRFSYWKTHTNLLISVRLVKKVGIKTQEKSLKIIWVISTSFLSPDHNYYTILMSRKRESVVNAFGEDICIISVRVTKCSYWQMALQLGSETWS